MSKTDFMVIYIGDCGEVSAMHREEFPLGFLGKQSIERASEIKFNEGTQEWDVHLPTGRMDAGYVEWRTIPAACGFSSYNIAREFEVGWLEHCALESVMPLSKSGQFIAATIRLNFL